MCEEGLQKHVSDVGCYISGECLTGETIPDRQTDRYFIDRKKVNPDLFVIELEICTCIYNIVNLLKSYDNIHSMTYITKIMLTGIAIRNTGYVL